jgi:hypothetical protein
LQKLKKIRSLRLDSTADAAGVGGQGGICESLISVGYALGNWPYPGKFLE